MKMTIRQLHETLDYLDATGLLDAVDGDVTIVYQPNYPLAAAATGCGFIIRDGAVELVIGCGPAGGDYADSRQRLAFDGNGYELVEEEDEDEG